MKTLVRNLFGVAGYDIKRIQTPSPLQEVRSPIAEIPCVPLTELLGDAKVTVQISVQRYEDGMLPYEQAIALVALLVYSDPQVVLEIGTFMGHTTRLMAMNLPSAIIHTVDLPLDFKSEADPVKSLKKDDIHLIQKRKVGREFLGAPCEKQIRQHFYDTATWDFNEAKGATFYFIDGAHTYGYCRNDSEKCYRLCNGKGVFVWHDVDETHPEVVKFIAEWRELGRNIVRIEGTPIAYWNSASASS